MSRRVNRDADGIVRGKIPTIRQYDTDARFRGGVSTSLYYTSTSAEDISLGKKWPDQMHSMSITNASNTVDLLATITVVKAGGVDHVFINKCKIKVGTVLVLTEEDLSIGSNEFFKITTSAALGTPACNIVVRF